MIPLAVAAVAAAALAAWLGERPQVHLKPRVPAPRPKGSRGAAASAPASAPAWAGRLERGGGSPADLPGAWGQFRGPRRDNVSRENVPLARAWPQTGPAVLWSVEMGPGYAAPAVRNGRVYVLDYDVDRQEDVLRCLSLAGGKDIWRYAYPVKVKFNHGMSRTVPAVSEKYVVSLGPRCHVLCLDSMTGEHLWHMDLVRRFGTTVPPWYAGQCPLIDGEKAILAPAGPDTLIMAVDCPTGRVLWKTPNPRRWEMTHSSVTPAELGGGPAYVYCGSGGVAGVSATDGELLWEHLNWRISIANVPTPVPLGGDALLFTGGYNMGAMILRVRREGQRFGAEEVCRLKHRVFGSEQQTPILYEGHVYGVRQGGQLVCLGVDGGVVWASGRQNRFGRGAYLIADGLILIVDDHGVLTAAEASPGGYRRLARAKVLPGPEAWGPMAIVAGRLILRDLNRMICLDLRRR